PARPAGRRLAGGPRPAGPLLPPPRGDARPVVRPGLGAGAVRPWRPALHRPGRLLRAPARPVLRGDPLRAPARRDGLAQPGPPLVPRLCPRRGPAGTLQPHPDPAAPGRRALPALLREGGGFVPRRGPGLGPGALLRRDQGRGQRRPRLAGPPLLPRGQDPRGRPVCGPARRRGPGTGGGRRRRAPKRRAAGDRACRRGRAAGGRSAVAAARGAAPGPEPTGRRHLPAHDRRPREPDRPRRHADAHQARDGPRLPRPLRGGRRQAPHRSSRPRHPGGRDGERADARPAVAGLLPAQAAPPPGHGRHRLRHRREHRGRRGRRHPRVRAASRLGIATAAVLRAGGLRRRRRAGRGPLPAAPAPRPRDRQARRGGGRLPGRRRDLQRLPGQGRVHREPPRAHRAPLPRRRLPGEGAGVPRDRGVQEGHAQAAGLGGAALRRGEGVARAEAIPAAGARERQRRRVAGRDRAEPEALPGRDGLGPPPRPLWEPRSPPRAAPAAGRHLRL
ncbi:MAG: hypothetical protein AVDCRST_MAG59-4090, partial [uncultured Thermomicrobiales bacterium]